VAAVVNKKRVLGFSPYAYGGAVPFENLFDGGTQDVKAYGFGNIDCFLLSGGTDWHPGYYNELHHKTNGADDEPSQRDMFEWKAMLYCRQHDIPMIGICRGAQGLCINAGGSLVQHVQGHGIDHFVTTLNGETLMTTSTHHQMMVPWDVPHKLLAYCDEPRSARYENGMGMDRTELKDKKEPEIVYFPEIKGLAIQGHPEYYHATSRFRNLCVDYVKEYLL
jgi:anthranilate/para-aminobenzoate synthase component II